MSNVHKFLGWLDQQDYWVKDERVYQVAEKYDVEFERMIGITKKMSDDGKAMTPRRDFRRHVKMP